MYVMYVSNLHKATLYIYMYVCMYVSNLHKTTIYVLCG